MDKYLKKMKAKIEEHLDLGSSDQRVLAPETPAIVPPLYQPPTSRQIYRFRKQREVNLGSWFTLEDWLTPSLFQQAAGRKSSEMDILEGMSQDSAKNMLEHHWGHFVDDGDWEWMASHGINTVRLPIGYFHFLGGHPNPDVRDLMKGTEYAPYADVYVNTWGYIVRAIETARAHKIGVLVDLHAAPGAQNPDNHSGLSTGDAGLWHSEKKQRKTVQILVALAQEIVRFDNVVGLEVLNEPKDTNRLQSWYEEAIFALQSISPEISEIPLYLSDAWATGHYAQFIAGRSNPGTFLVLDHHLYRCFTSDDHALSASQHAANVHPANPDAPSTSMLSGASGTSSHSIVIGEWSAALNPASFSSYQDENAKLAAQREWGYAQWEAYERFCGGYFFWTLKKEGGSDPGWCYYTAVEKGVLPSSLDRAKDNFSRHSLEHLRSVGASELQAAMQGHVGWWNNNSQNPGAFEHWRFEQGYYQGWEDCLAFYWGSTTGELVGSEIGFKGQWKKLRTEAHRREKGDSEMVWEFEHGFDQALTKFSEVIVS
ncbi:glycoside hydrolase superfamily [Desarmillaria tabescens]|uniref:Glycoside hydrolase superfamily n=1 Tax=Armillaria tabescens TaxID=1929756 RepID=A0AA39K651_ARMTA|nr:glycoside hydrolase superfamily [Desarmillaria tabescens]KAK0454061.1 glycoside hydrolase superfamily [Desarmillaria tabescens]